jgi:photosystem II stability/assembly factor-like uncharacterized protein
MISFPDPDEPYGGTSWSVENYPAGLVTLYAAVFPSPDTGYVAGDRSDGAGTVMRTIDAGKTWTELTTGTINTLYALSFPNAKTGWAVGSGELICRTTDVRNS